MAKRPHGYLAMSKDLTPGPARLGVALLAGAVACRGLYAAAARITRLTGAWGPWGRRKCAKPASEEPKPDAEEPTDEAEGPLCTSAMEQWVVPVDQRPAPPVAASREFKLATEALALPVSVFDFYRVFLSCESSALEEHYTGNLLSVQMGRWRRGADGALRRSCTFVQPRGGVQPCDVPCTQRHILTVHSDGSVMLTTAQTQHSSPYCDAFSVHGSWRVRPTASGGCDVRIYAAVLFTRNVLVRPLIASSGFGGARAFLSKFLEQVRCRLQTSGGGAAWGSPAAPAQKQFSRMRSASPRGASLPGALLTPPPRDARFKGSFSSHLTKGQACLGGEAPVGTGMPRAPGQAALAATSRAEAAVLGALTRASKALRGADVSLLQALLLLVMLVLQALVVWDNRSTQQQIAALLSEGVCPSH